MAQANNEQPEHLLLPAQGSIEQTMQQHRQIQRDEQEYYEVERMKAWDHLMVLSIFSARYAAIFIILL
ncbi:hypothetical protein [Ktedonosporobacter rubrisoli]|uniref:hypothetical protein n=1 Tax=Ktedonosporobacter rubrisoli TaxID=2509675 RepID=UPI001F5CF3DE|nr:hypothetical protein [Ktedonosporobacter rubrisoli]